MKKKLVLGIAAVAVLGIGGYLAFGRGNGDEAEIEYRYAKLEEGELVRSISATGQLVPLTTVDIRSRAGGTVVRLAVDLGTVVRRGDLIAEIDPSDTQALYDQANADLTSAQARAAQARTNLQLQVAQSRTAVEDARAALRSAEIRYETARLQTNRQPTLTRSSLATAQAALDAAIASRDRLVQVDIPQREQEARSGLDAARANLDAAEADLRRQQSLNEEGFVAGSAVERARSTAAGARSQFAAAEQRLRTLQQQFAADRREADTAVARAEASLRQARANSSDDAISQKTLDQQRQAVIEARIALQQAIDNQKQVEVRRSEVQAAQASTVRSSVQVRNARINLDSTRVLAPRDGVVVQKYIEEGTVIPAGTSTFSQGTAIVQIADVTQLFVDTAVDEADIGQVAMGQRVRILTEAFPGEFVDGEVVRINPAATTVQNVTGVTVRVKVLPGFKLNIKPGMNATCEFITLNKPKVLIAPSQAIRNEAGETFVLVKTADPKKPEKRVVKVGERGNEGVEILDGLKPGEEVVIAEVNLAEMRELQRKMAEAKEGGGLVGGAPGGGGRGMGGGGGRGGGGGGGGRPGGGR